MQKQTSNTSEFKLISDFLLQNYEKTYKAPKNAENNKEKIQMESLKKAGITSNKIFNEKLSLLAANNGLFDVKNRNFLDGSCKRIRNYFWGQLKFAEYYQYPESISVFCEVVDKKCVRYRVSLEINERTADEEDLENFLRVLDKPLTKGLCYMGNIKFNRSLEIISSNKKDIKDKLATGRYNKIQVTYLPGFCETDVDMFKELDKGIKLLLPYYSYIMN